MKKKATNDVNKDQEDDLSLEQEAKRNMLKNVDRSQEEPTLTLK